MDPFFVEPQTVLQALVFVASATLAPQRGEGWEIREEGRALLVPPPARKPRAEGAHVKLDAEPMLREVLGGVARPQQ